MDSGGYSGGYQRSSAGGSEQWTSRDDRSSLRPDFASSVQPLSAPIPQTQWTTMPDAFRPPSWGSSSVNRDKPLPTPPTNEQHRSMIPNPLSLPKMKRRKQVPGKLQSPERSNSLRPDPGMLYPHMNPYDTSGMVRSAPHNVQHFPRMHGQPARLDIFAARSSSADPRPSVLPRSPTYPGGSRARIRSVSTGNDNALQDEEEFRLFIEATTGLGPIPTFRQNSVTEDHWNSTSSEPRFHQQPTISEDVIVSPTSVYSSTPITDTRHQFGMNDTMSPIGETPTTIQALQGLAQMPRARSTSSERRRRANVSEPIVDISDSGLNIWDESTRAPLPHHHMDSWLEANEPGLDDELPTYASSQAQAHASQRAEATRRAQELQRRWREGGRRYGPEA